MMEDVKMLPYGISDFEDLRRQNLYYADKTKYIPLLERAGNFLFLIRPRRFGKSIFLSMLRCYYDIARQDEFDTLFDGLWIKDNPSELKGAFQIMYFDFSQATVGRGDLEERFHKYCSAVLCDFADRYKKHYGERFYDTVLDKAPDSGDQLRYICMEAKKRKIQLYLIIDEYDNFTNDVLNEQGEAVYHALTHATGFYREVFKIYKANFQKILFMGISPVTLDDLTSGFNIARNITTDPRFNMMLGFSETEVRDMISYYKEVGMITADIEQMIEEMKPWYDNYCFAEESLDRDPKMLHKPLTLGQDEQAPLDTHSTRVFNSDMVIYYLRNHIDFGCAPKQMLDVNTRTDYKKLKKLVQLDGMTDRERSIIKQIASERKILANIKTSFPAERIFDKENFISLLYYYGMLTIKGQDLGRLVLGVPNNNVLKQYYEYLLTEYQPEARVDTFELEDSFRGLALDGDYRTTLTIIADSYEKVSSNRDGIEGERNFQGFMMAYLNLTPLYLTVSEAELAHGYCDILLLPDKKNFPAIRHSYIIELKYLSADAGENEAQKQWDKGVERVRHYATSRKAEVLAGDTEMHLVVMQMKAYKLFRLEEIRVNNPVSGGVF